MSLTSPKTEKFYQNGLLLLASYSPNISFKQEVSLPNPKPGSVKSRRLDMVQDLPDLLRIYEIKKDFISLEIVESVMLDKEYIKLAKNRFGKPVQLVFTSPSGITNAAKRFLKTFPNACYISTKELATILYQDYVDSLIPEAKWHADRVREEFNLLLT